MLFCSDSLSQSKFAFGRGEGTQWLTRGGFAVVADSRLPKEDPQFLTPMAPATWEADPVLYWIMDPRGILRQPVHATNSESRLDINEYVSCFVTQRVVSAPGGDSVSIYRETRFTTLHSPSTWTNRIRWSLSDFRSCPDGLRYPATIELEFPGLTNRVQYTISKLTPADTPNQGYRYAKETKIKIPGVSRRLDVGTIIDLRDKPACFRRSAFGGWRAVALAEGLLDRPRTQLLDILGWDLWLQANWPWLVLATFFSVAIAIEFRRWRKARP